MAKNIRGEVLPAAVYENYGRLAAAVELEFPEYTSAAWTGKISVADRLGNQVSPSELREALRPENVDSYFVKADVTAPTRCIDGRCVHGYGHELALADRPLGPQVPGGTPTAALCRRVADWDSINNNERPTLVDDIEAMSDLVDHMGGHIDDQAQRGKTGCGAIDRMPEILNRITTPDAQEQVRDLVHLLLGAHYYRDEVDAIIGRLVSLQGKAKRYFVYNKHKDIFEYNTKAIAALQKRDRAAVEKLDGTHNEVALVVNLVDGTTFQRDQFAYDNNRHIQLFNYDFWRTLQVARKLYPHTESESPERHGRNKRLRTRYVTARALFAIGTAMVLTDGSLDLIVRVPKQ